VFCNSCGQAAPEESRFCHKCGKPLGVNQTETAPVRSPIASVGIRCKTCDVGVLRSEKRYRMSGPVVAIGYILLVPSILGVALSLFMFMSVAGSTGSASPGSDASAAIAGGIASGIIIVIGVIAFVFGLLGWLLVMKRKVLRCATCGAVVPAS